MAKKSVRAPTGFDVTLGGLLRERRKDIGMSQGELADSIGVTFQQIGKYEAGTNRLCVERLIQICDALGVKPAAFLDRV